MKIIALVFLIIAPQAVAEGGAYDEKSLWQLAKDSQAPMMQQINASLEAAHLGVDSVDANFGARLIGGAGYSDTNEAKVSNLSPVFAPTNQVSLGVQKNFRKGFSAALTTSSSQRSTTDGLINKNTRSETEFKVTMDLWKNLLGSLDQSKMDQAQFDREKAEAQAVIDRKGYEIDVRKMYWSMIANRESLNLAEGLLGSAKRQLVDSEARLASSVGNNSEVARLRAQVASRQNVIALLKYERVQLEKGLRRMIPSLGGQPIQLAKVDLEKVVSEVQQCALVIGTRPPDPLSDTSYGKLLGAIDRSYVAKKAITDTTNEMDLKLVGSYKVIGSDADSDYSSTYGEMMRGGRDGHSVALELSVPLGQSMNRLENRKHAVEKASYEAEKRHLLAQLSSQKDSIIPLVKLLNEAVKNQKTNSALLGKSVMSVEKRYKQARLSLMELIREQDALQDSQLREIDAYLQVIHTILDHFRVFTELPCSMNSLS